MSSSVTINGIQTPVRIETEKTVKFTLDITAEQVEAILLDYAVRQCERFKGGIVEMDVSGYGLFRGATISAKEHESDAE